MNKKQLQQEIAELQKQLEEKQKALSAMPDKWEPEGGEWYVSSEGDAVYAPSCNSTRVFGTEYNTMEQAEKAAKSMRAHNRLLAYVAEFEPDWEADWNDHYQTKAEVIFDKTLGEWLVDISVDGFSPSAVYMPDEAAEELAVKLNSGEVEL